MIATIPSELLRALRLTLVFGVVTGLLYSLAMTGIAQLVFPGQANGSLISVSGQIVGSSLIGQYFKSEKYFHGRVSNTTDPNTGKPLPYAANNSAGSNLGPTNKVLIDRVKADVVAIRKENNSTAPVPIDLVTMDFTGFDPDVSEAGALYQVNRVAQVRGLDPAKVHALVEKYVQGRVLGIFGQPHVNILQLNMALDNGEGR